MFLMKLNIDFVPVSKDRLIDSYYLRKECCIVVCTQASKYIEHTRLNDDDFQIDTFTIYSKIIEKVNIAYCSKFVTKAKSNNTSRNKASISDTEAFRTALKVQAKKNIK